MCIRDRQGRDAASDAVSRGHVNVLVPLPAQRDGLRVAVDLERLRIDPRIAEAVALGRFHGERAPVAVVDAQCFDRTQPVARQARFHGQASVHKRDAARKGRVPKFLNAVRRAGDDLILIHPVQLHEVAAPAPYAVSYTHLDVYKRQAPDSGAHFRPRRSASLPPSPPRICRGCARRNTSPR